MTDTARTPETRILLPMDRIEEICRKYDVTELAIFGSALRDDFRPDSDVDFLITFRENDAGPWGGKLMDVERELSVLLGRPVDVVSRGGIEKSPNWIIRKSILRTVEVVYGS